MSLFKSIKSVVSVSSKVTVATASVSYNTAKNLSQAAVEANRNVEYVNAAKELKQAIKDGAREGNQWGKEHALMASNKGTKLLENKAAMFA